MNEIEPKLNKPLIIITFIFVTIIGIGLGMIFGDKQIGTMLGLGIGILVKVFYSKYCGKK